MREIDMSAVTTITLGRLGENRAAVIRFHCEEWEDTYGVGTFGLVAKHDEDSTAHPCAITVEDGVVSWEITSQETQKKGYGRCELFYTVGGVVAKSDIYRTYVADALTGGETPPEPYDDWLVQAVEAAGDAEAAKQGAIAAKQETQALFPAGGTAGQVLTKTADGTEWADVQGGGTGDHSQLTNRDAEDQHPISAITGLQSALDGKSEVQIDDTTPAADKVYSSQKVSTDLAQKADKTALAETDESLDLLWKLTKGQAWDVTADNNEAYSKTIPSGTHLSVLKGWGGKSIVWNQIVNIDNSQDMNPWMHQISEGVFEITKDIGRTNVYLAMLKNGFSKPNVLIDGHKYYAKVTSNKPYDSNVAELYAFAATRLGSGESFVFNWQSTDTANQELVIKLTQSDELVNTVYRTICVDLTQMFGTSADSMTKEQCDSFFHLDYYPYSEPTLMSADVANVVLKDDDSVTVKTLNVPASVRALEGYGWSAGSVANTVEYDAEQGKWFYHKRVNKYVYTGRETMMDASATVGSTTRYYAYLLEKAGVTNATNGVSTLGKEITRADSNASIGDFAIENAVLYFYVPLGDPVSSVNEIYTAGNSFTYELAEEVVTDITSLMAGFDNYLDSVEAGGALTFVNSHGDDYRIPVPSNIDHYRNLSEVTP